MEQPIWAPDPGRIARANLTAFIRRVRASNPAVTDYSSLYDWSVSRPDLFWPEVWEFCEIVADERAGRLPWDEVVVGLERMAPPDRRLGARWFPGARLNYAENLLRYNDDRPAIVFWNERGRQRVLTFAELRREVAAVASALRAADVGAGDRVAGFLPNLPEAIVAMLATASLGAIWSSCSPDFGANGVLDRFGQIAPRVLFSADGYRYAGKEIDSLARAREVGARIPAIERVVVVPYLRRRPDLGSFPGAVEWDDFLSAHRDAGHRFDRMPFDHPLYIMYSSGTTGLPKCMVHGAGGTLLQHLKELVLHTDLTRDDRMFYFTTCGWMMWNWMVSSLAVGATVILFDGAPLAPPSMLWDMAAAEWSHGLRDERQVSGALRKRRASSRPARTTRRAPGDLSRPEARSPVTATITCTVRSSATSTSPASAAARTSSPASRWAIRSLRSGAVNCRLGDWAWRSRSSTSDGRPVRERDGELVCTRPFPSMPIAFWDDPDGAKYRAAYFDRYPGVWRHGDWARLTGHDGLIILGRSDATLNPGGVRIGTAEIYRQVEQQPRGRREPGRGTGVAGRRAHRALREIARWTHARRGLTRSYPALHPGACEPSSCS